MKILTLNCWGGREHRALIDYLRDTQADILCLQEVIHTPNAEKDWLTYVDGATELPQRARLFEEICAALPNHNGTFCPAAQGDLWDGTQRHASQWGLATFVRKDIPVIAQAQAFVHGEYSAHGYGDHPRARNAHAIRVYDYDCDMPATIVHLHGLRNPQGKHDTPERRQQAKRLIALTRSISQDDRNVVVCGDFNVLPESITFAELQSIGLTELVTARNLPGTRTSLYPKPGKFADYMFVSKALEAAPFEIVRQPEVSDHCPLVLELKRK
ncbi:endonuclease/exonuclease/phosphatase family protein [Rhizobium sp. L1K21]|uniref:endonuclease/exonuclease/phosphatase family protein n=1 Tax=Rhizobium sp. L1K21 TaxID=2954933 RepID=UPI00209299DB|nr:endonuclease/exonuclease/phosphatase family protein [Rhizobium sp. L1K21]MCO6185521.1 endonuclease/exonuclease/phosphatase family protein [Rhizobium sp. L1K21]